MSEYPESWVTMALSDAVINVTITDKKIPQKEYLSEGAYPVFDQGQEFIGGYTDKREKLVECELPVIVFGDHTRAIKFVNQPFAAGADGVKVLQPKCFYIPRLFEYFSLHLATHLTSHGYARHYQYLAKSIIPLPPTNEQHRIVAKIEALFSELDKGIESFKTAREQLKIYRQALLKHAFSGKLTEQWRAENAGKLESVETLLQRIQTERQQRYQQQLKDWEKSVIEWEKNGKPDKKPKKPRLLDYSVFDIESQKIELPSDWRWCNLGDVISDLTDYHANGSYETLKENVELTDSPDFALMVRATNFEKQNFHSDQKYISKTAYDFLSKSKLFGNEILIGKIGNAGKVYFMPELHRPASLAMNLFCLRFDSVISKYIYFHLLTEFSKNQISQFVKGVGNPTIDKISIRSLSIALPSVEEQQQILGVLEKRLSIIDQLDQTITTASQQVEALRQSILKKAFSGQLVPQDTNDEPASVLLERIQAEKAAQAAQSKPKKTPKRKATA